SEIKEASTSIQLVAVSFILGFNGFSIHAQVASILSNTDIRYKAYLYGRLMHALFSSIICWAAFKWYTNHLVTFNEIISVGSLFISEQLLQFLHFIYI